MPQVGLEASHLSQQLGVLRRAGVVQSRKDGSTVFYSVSDPRIFELLELAKQILSTSLLGSQELLHELESLAFTDKPAKKRRTS
jgi:ArsR family transcriptional regulator